VSFCAICTADIAGEPTREPLGKGGAMVAVCSSCADEQPVEKHGPKREYEENEGGDVRRLVDEASRRIFGEKRTNAARKIGLNPIAPQRYGWLVVRVPHRDREGRPRDRRDAMCVAIVEFGVPIRFVTTTTGFFVFERPNPRAAETKTINPLEAIEQFRVDTKPQRKP
jgi:hypothetical protein